MDGVNHPRRQTPGLPVVQFDGLPSSNPPMDIATIRLQALLVIEEAFEFVEAIFGKNGRDLKEFHEDVKALINNEVPHVDLEKLADAAADTDYVIEHARQTFGIDGDPIADEVHRANMLKLEGPKDPVTGKQLKPPGWTPPDIRGCLQKQCVTETVEVGAPPTSKVNKNGDAFPDVVDILICPKCHTRITRTKGADFTYTACEPEFIGSLPPCHKTEDNYDISGSALRIIGGAHMASAEELHAAIVSLRGTIGTGYYDDVSLGDDLLKRVVQYLEHRLAAQG